MAITLNAKGTTNPFFKIGRRGTTLYQGAADPSITYTILQGDIWIDTTSNSLKFRNGSNAWTDSSSYNDTDVTAHLSQFDSNILPDTDDAYTLGNATNRWQNLYASNGTIDTLTVSGDLVVSGAVTTIDTQNLTVADNIIILNNDVTGTPTEDAGLEIERGTATNVSVAWNESTDRWSFTNDGTTYFNLAVNTDDITEGSSNLYYTNARVDTRLALTIDTITNAPTAGQILVWDAVNSKFIPSNNVSVGADAVASGSGAINYNSATGVLTYTPPDLSSYIASVAFSDITSKPTTIAGYGITDAFSGAYTDLTGKPTLPTSLLDLNITDGTVGQILVTNGNGAFSFSDIINGTFTGTLTGNVIGSLNGNVTGTLFGDHQGDVKSPSSLVPIITTGPVRDTLSIHDAHIDKIKAPGTNGATILDTSGATTLSGHNVHLTGALYGDIGDTLANNPVLTVGTGNNDSQLVVTTASIDDLSVQNPTVTRTLTQGNTDYYTKQYVLSGTTTDATETELFVRGVPNNRIPVATDTTIFYDISFVARRTDATGESAGLVLKGVVDNFSGTVADVGDLYEILVASDNVNLAVEAAADNTNDAIKVTVTGEASKTFRWTAIVKTTEVAQ